jgi:hypothetical protein
LGVIAMLRRVLIGVILASMTAGAAAAGPVEEGYDVQHHRGVIMAVYEVSLSDIRANTDPLNGQMWKCDPIAVEEVKTAIGCRLFDKRPWKEVKDVLDPAEHRSYHIARIAFLAVNPADENDQDKIALAIAPDRVWLYDGSHRVAAAIVRGDATLRLAIASYDDAAITSHLPSARLSG